MPGSVSRTSSSWPSRGTTTELPRPSGATGTCRSPRHATAVDAHARVNTARLNWQEVDNSVVMKPTSLRVDPCTGIDEDPSGGGQSSIAGRSQTSKNLSHARTRLSDPEACAAAIGRAAPFTAWPRDVLLRLAAAASVSSHRSGTHLIVTGRRCDMITDPRRRRGDVERVEPGCAACSLQVRRFVLCLRAGGSRGWARAASRPGGRWSGDRHPHPACRHSWRVGRACRRCGSRLRSRSTGAAAA